MTSGMKTTKFLFKFCILLILLIVVSFLFILFVPKSINNVNTNLLKKVLLDIRLVELLTSIVAGFILGLSGCLMQTVLNNLLASPFTLGTQASAAFGASIAILEIIPFATNLPISLVAFLASSTSIFILILLISFFGESKQTIIIAGVAINFMFNAGNSLLKYFATLDKLYDMTFWTYGSFQTSRYQDVGLMLIIFLVGILFSILMANDLTQISLGEKIAISAGINVKRTRILILLIASLLASVSVSSVGVIGFIGLVAPFFSRLLGLSHPKFLIFSTPLIGAILLVTANSFSKIILQPVILPVGAITSLLGVPCLLFIMIFTRKKHV